MKIIGLVFLFLGISAAQACEVNSAQFIGNVRDVRIERIDQGIRDCFSKSALRNLAPRLVAPFILEERKVSFWIWIVAIKTEMRFLA